MGTALLPILALALFAGASGDQPAAQGDPLVEAMQAELARSMEKLARAGEEPLHFLAYRVWENESLGLTASHGALVAPARRDRARFLVVEARVGTPELDSTHPIRDDEPAGHPWGEWEDDVAIPLEDDPAAIRTALWLATDAAFKLAQQRFQTIKADRDVKVAEEDSSADFTREKSQVAVARGVDFQLDMPSWEGRLRKLSAVYNDHAHVLESSFGLSVERERRILVTSEGTCIDDQRIAWLMGTSVHTVAQDGMELWLTEDETGPGPEFLKDDAHWEEVARRLAATLAALRGAPVAEPFAGPAILKARAAGVFFHEIFGHRIEGHRQKNEEEGRTFAKKIGERVMPEFISVVDDPTLQYLGARPLNGSYQFDDEGVPAQRVVLVEGGVLRSFLLGRSPVRGFPNSNGHGRCAAGSLPVARQGNLMVTSTRTVPYEELRAALVAEVKRQGKPYGLIFDDIEGGFTQTEVSGPQAFKVEPLIVYRVFPDGRPDELIRGVDLSGTPLTSLEHILLAAADPDIFNGHCGAESGWVPVAAVSPSLLVGTIEAERREKSPERPPILPPPGHDPAAKAPAKE